MQHMKGRGTPIHYNVNVTHSCGIPNYKKLRFGARLQEIKAILMTRKKEVDSQTLFFFLQPI